MELVTDFNLPMYSTTELLMDDVTITVVDFVTRLDKFKVDRITIDEAQDDLCFQARDHFEEERSVSLNSDTQKMKARVNGTKGKSRIHPILPYPLTSKNYLKTTLLLNFCFCMQCIQKTSTEKFTIPLTAHIYLQINGC